ncbi:hypothetical protein CHCC5027_3549 [Bacillus paralicheniformis]|uniref:hypothetical protein n=1 Tax=Bacillus paralicheniformis TaxID=1648923 RepID=UPI0011A321AA|nr:hypothetical protein [Bacillus paralicheniformis]TWJ39636.1 hypothetical protein CHCC5027_3549 [Bacillus paralicheniformis]
MTNINEEVLAGWGAVDQEDNNKGNSKKKNDLDFLKIPYGDTKIRVLDVAPHVYKEWWSTKGNGGQGCSIPFFEEGDLLEAENQAFMSKIFKQADKKNLKDKARKDFLRDEGYKKQPWGKVKNKNIIHVLDRATGEVKLLDSGNGIFKEIKKYATNPEYGDPRQYDITITKTDTKGNGDFHDIEYTVTPARSNTPLTPEEEELYKSKKIDLVEYKTPDMTPEQALRIAKGATFKEVLGKDSDSAEESDSKSDESMLPPQEETPEEPPKEEKEQPIEIDKDEELSAEELESLEF